MKTLAAFAIALLIALPAAADFRTSGQSLVWFKALPTADVSQMRDALLWRYDSRPLDGLLATASRPQIAITDLGGGVSELTVTMALAAGNSWVAAIATRCPEATNTATRRTCADAFIRADLRETWQQYRAHLREQSTPIQPVPDL